jgi:hypothetical protein
VIMSFYVEAGQYYYNSMPEQDSIII